METLTDRRPLEAPLAAFAVIALLTAVFAATLWSRPDGDLDWGVYAFGLLATAVLLLGTVTAWRLVGDPERRATLMGWPGAAAAVSVGMMVGVAMDDADNVLYVIGGLILVLSVLGHLVVPRPAFVTSALLGVVMVWGEALTDAYGEYDLGGEAGDNIGVVTALAVVALTVVVTVPARRFLPSRDFAGILVGAFAVVALVGLSAALGVFGMLSMAFAGLGEEEEVVADNPYTNDYWVILLCGLALVVFWLGLYWRGGHQGYRVLGLVMAPVLVPVIALLLETDHHSAWVGVSAAVGIAALGGALASALGVLRPSGPTDRGPYHGPTDHGPSSHG